MRDDVRGVLRKAAAGRRKVTYGFLMKRFRLSRGAPGRKGVVGVVGEIDREEGRNGAPGFAAIVVRNDTGYPGGGFFCWEGVPSALRRSKGDGQNPRLSEAEKEYVRRLQEEIWSFYSRGRRPAPKKPFGFGPRPKAHGNEGRTRASRTPPRTAT